jgi:hypothetical protein
MIATMTKAAAKSRLLGLMAVSVAAVALAGCGDGGVELNGKLFDALGVSEASQRNAKSEPKLRERTGLVVPPDTNRLPEPGSGAAGEPDLNSQVSDPERRKALAAAEKARLHQAYCSGEANWKERVADRNASARAPTSPYGPCGGLGEALKQ